MKKTERTQRSRQALLALNVFFFLFAASARAQEVSDWLFIQQAGSGTLEVAPGEPGEYLLTLYGVPRQMTVFTGEAGRRAAAVETEKFVKGLTKDTLLANPPRAALDRLDDLADEIAVLELREPFYDAALGAATYRARIVTLPDQRPKGFEDRAMTQTLTGAFGPSVLFIDHYRGDFADLTLE